MSYAVALDRPTPMRGSGTYDDSRNVGRQTSARPNLYYQAATRDQQDFAIRFERLVADWEADTMLTSSLDEMCSHPSYLAIIGMGPRVLPYLLRQLERSPNYWFAALRAIAQVDPARSEDYGNLQALADAWINWGQKEGYA